MGRIVLAWELGANFAHLSRLLPLALALRGRGHGIEFVVRDLARGQALLASHGFTLLQAPVWLGKTPPLATAPNYAGVIRRCGYHAVPPLAGLVAGWLRLYDLTEPDLVIAEHAPTAALAARCRGLAALRFGTGWSVPPATSPLPSVTPWSRYDPRQMQVAEAQVVAAINGVLAAQGAAKLRRLAELFDPGTEILATFPETDHYGERAGVRYWGAVERSVAAAAPDWPAGTGERIFAFVEAGYEGLDALAAALAALGQPAILYVRDLPPAKARTLAAPALRVVTAPVDFDRVVREARLVICHGGHGSVTGALRAGVPLLLLPRHAEQRLLAHRLTGQRFATAIARRKDAAPSFADAIRGMLDTSSYGDAARGFAARHAAHDIDATIAAIADACEAALAGRRAAAPAPATG
jgi:UDP:flavonoid glycosyltransferase YjiC (YdhE family)